MNAHDGAHPAGVAVGTGGEQHHPEDDPATGLQGEEVRHQLEHILEVGDEGEAGTQRQQDPGQMLGPLRASFSAFQGEASSLRRLLAAPSSFSSNQMNMKVHTVCGQR